MPPSRTLAELATIVEVGEWKVQNYGPHILATLNGKLPHHERH